MTGITTSEFATTCPGSREPAVRDALSSAGDMVLLAVAEPAMGLRDTETDLGLDLR